MQKELALAAAGGGLGSPRFYLRKIRCVILGIAVRWLFTANPYGMAIAGKQFATPTADY
jgi:hypothetical protein